MKLRRSGLYIATAAALVLLAAIVFHMASGGGAETPAVILPSAPVQSEAAQPEESGRDQTKIDVTPETVQAALSTLSRADSYSRQLEVESFWTGGSSKVSISVWVHGSSSRFVISGRGAEKNVLLLDNELWIWYSDSSDVYSGSADEGAADEYQMLLTYERILDLPKDSISEAGYTEHLGEKCIYVCFSAGELGYTYRCWVSVESGLLMGCTATDKSGELIYKVSSSTPDISTPDESVFAVPD